LIEERAMYLNHLDDPRILARECYTGGFAAATVERANHWWWWWCPTRLLMR
jgi:hypothetical protein